MTFASISISRGRFGWFATISSPVTGRAAASARFLSLGAAKYLFLDAERERTAHQHDIRHGSRKIRLRVISVPSRVVVCRHLQPAAEARSRKPQAIRDMTALAPHLTNHRSADTLLPLELKIMNDVSGPASRYISATIEP
jgi:hypothetical protein